jgi:hypothetical protein
MKIRRGKWPLSPPQTTLVANSAHKEDQSQQSSQSQLKHFRREAAVHQIAFSGCASRDPGRPVDHGVDGDQIAGC